MTNNMRSLRLSVPDTMYDQIELYAKVNKQTIAMAARFVLGFGLATVDALTDPKRAPAPVDLDEARERCSEAMGYVQSGQSDPALYRMLYDLMDVLDPSRLPSK